jgi:hypothetical protein
MGLHKIIAYIIAMWSLFFISWQLWAKPFLEPNLTIRWIETIIAIYFGLVFLIYTIEESKKYAGGKNE